MTEARAISDGVDLKALIERVREAKGPSREIDAELFVALSGEVPADAGRIDRLGGLVGWWPRDSHYESAREVPEYTASIDAALGLVTKLLPGWKWGVASVAVKTGEKSSEGYPRYGEGFRAHVTKISALRPMPSIGEHQTAPLAILLALLTSLFEDTTHAK